MDEKSRLEFNRLCTEISSLPDNSSSCVKRIATLVSLIRETSVTPEHPDWTEIRDTALLAARPHTLGLAAASAGAMRLCRYLLLPNGQTARELDRLGIQAAAIIALERDSSDVQRTEAFKLIRAIVADTPADLSPVVAAGLAALTASRSTLSRAALTLLAAAFAVSPRTLPPAARAAVTAAYFTESALPLRPLILGAFVTHPELFFDGPASTPWFAALLAPLIGPAAAASVLETAPPTKPPKTPAPTPAPVGAAGDALAALLTCDAALAASRGLLEPVVEALGAVHAEGALSVLVDVFLDALGVTRAHRLAAWLQLERSRSKGIYIAHLESLGQIRPITAPPLSPELSAALGKPASRENEDLLPNSPSSVISTYLNTDNIADLGFSAVIDFVCPQVPRPQTPLLAAKHHALLTTTLLDLGIMRSLVQMLFSDRLPAHTPLHFDALLLFAELGCAQELRGPQSDLRSVILAAIEVPSPLGVAPGRPPALPALLATLDAKQEGVAAPFGQKITNIRCDASEIVVFIARYVEIRGLELSSSALAAAAAAAAAGAATGAASWSPLPSLGICTQSSESGNDHFLTFNLTDDSVGSVTVGASTNSANSVRARLSGTSLAASMIVALGDGANASTSGSSGSGAGGCGNLLLEQASSEISLHPPATPAPSPPYTALVTSAFDDLASGEVLSLLQRTGTLTASSSEALRAWDWGLVLHVCNGLSHPALILAAIDSGWLRRVTKFFMPPVAPRGGLSSAVPGISETKMTTPPTRFWRVSRTNSLAPLLLETARALVDGVLSTTTGATAWANWSVGKALRWLLEPVVENSEQSLLSSQTANSTLTMFYPALLSRIISHPGSELLARDTWSLVLKTVAIPFKTGIAQNLLLGLDLSHREARAVLAHGLTAGAATRYTALACIRGHLRQRQGQGQGDETINWAVPLVAMQLRDPTMQVVQMAALVLEELLASPSSQGAALAALATASPPLSSLAPRIALSLMKSLLKTEKGRVYALASGWFKSVLNTSVSSNGVGSLTELARLTKELALLSALRSVPAPYHAVFCNFAMPHSASPVTNADLARFMTLSENSSATATSKSTCIVTPLGAGAGAVFAPAMPPTAIKAICETEEGTQMMIREMPHIPQLILASFAALCSDFGVQTVIQLPDMSESGDLLGGEATLAGISELGASEAGFRYFIAKNGVIKSLFGLSKLVHSGVPAPAPASTSTSTKYYGYLLRESALEIANAALFTASVILNSCTRAKHTVALDFTIFDKIALPPPAPSSPPSPPSITLLLENQPPPPLWPAFNPPTTRRAPPVSLPAIGRLFSSTPDLARGGANVVQEPGALLAGAGAAGVNVLAALLRTCNSIGADAGAKALAAVPKEITPLTAVLIVRMLSILPFRASSRRVAMDFIGSCNSSQFFSVWDEIRENCDREILEGWMNEMI